MKKIILAILAISTFAVSTNAARFNICQLTNGCGPECCALLYFKGASDCSQVKIYGADGREWVQGTDYSCELVEGQVKLIFSTATTPSEQLRVYPNDDVYLEDLTNGLFYYVTNIASHITNPYNIDTRSHFSLDATNITIQYAQATITEPFIVAGSDVNLTYSIATIKAQGPSTPPQNKTASVHNRAVNYSVNVYPNPSKNVNITFEIQKANSGLPNNYTIQLYNSFGQIVLNKKFTDNTIVIDPTNFAKGIYFYRILEGKVAIKSSTVVIE